MAKNIVIQEGGSAKSFSNTAKIQTSLIGGGSQDWIPEDEARDYAFANGEIHLGDLSVDDVGVYSAASEDLDGYANVTVDVPLGKLSVSENGYYSARDEGYVGFSEVDVALPSGTIPGGREVHGIASQDLALYQTVKVTPGEQNLSVISNSAMDGWLRADNLLYKVENNHVNAYNPTTGILVKTGLDYVYGHMIMNGGACMLLLLNTWNTTPANARFKALFFDGNECIFTINNVYSAPTFASNTENCLWGGYNNDIIAIRYNDGKYLSNKLKANTINTYNRNGHLLAEKIGAIPNSGWTGSTANSIIDITPISKNEIAAIYFSQPNYYWQMRNCIIRGTRDTQPATNAHGFVTDYSRSDAKYKSTMDIGYYGGYFYFAAITWADSNYYHLYRINIEDIENDYETLSYVQDATKYVGNINMYGHFQVYANGKYRVYDIKTLTEVYPNLIQTDTSRTAVMPENATYIIYDKTYMKGTYDIIEPTNQYPATHVDGVVLGIMKADCSGGAEGTVIVLFD